MKEVVRWLDGRGTGSNANNDENWTLAILTREKYAPSSASPALRPCAGIMTIDNRWRWDGHPCLQVF